LAGTSGTPTALSEGSANVNGAYGTLTIYSNGTYSYTPNNAAAEALPQGTPATDVFTYTAKDVHGATATTTLTFNITGQNDAPVVTSAAAAVSEEGLSNGVADALPAFLDTTDNTSASGTITASDVDTGDTLTMTLGTPSTSLTSGGVAIAWTLQDT